ncbi:MAG TPA: 3-dehydroquinate synthase, partial [Ignavibacteriaceae bacterium]|nr:3-dehydroquinate synthase [Ignavibacteriaceae bacterium]
MKKIEIKTKFKNYPVIIGDSVLDSVNDLINTLNLNKNLFVVVDEHVFNLHKEYITNVFNDKTLKASFYKFNSSEFSKSFESLKEILSELTYKKYGRDTLLISIGGGVTGDIAGFASSVYMRGIQVAHIPTTLLACVDSAIGGKTGINFNNYKNIIGAFQQPEFVL